MLKQRRVVIARDVLPTAPRRVRRPMEPHLGLVSDEALPPRLSLTEVLAYPQGMEPRGETPQPVKPVLSADRHPVPEVASDPVQPSEMEQHRQAVLHLSKVAACFFIACGLTYLSDDFAAQRPWIAGEPIPVLRKVMSVDWPCAFRGLPAGCQEHAPAIEQSPDEPAGVLLAGLGVASAPKAQGGPMIPLANTIAVAALKTEFEQELFDEPIFRPTPLTKRKIGKPTRIETLNHFSMDAFFERLKAAEENQGITHARIAFFGDSTNSLDGVTSTLRDRLQHRFGDGGPGFMVIGHFKQQNRRDHLLYRRRGHWERSPTIWKTSAPGGRYGLGGIVSRNKGRASVEFAPRLVAGKRDRVHRLELYYQGQRTGGQIRLEVDGKSFEDIETKSRGRVDRREVYDFEEPRSHFRLRMGSRDKVALYGAVMEKRQSGVVLDNLSLVGAEFGSYKKQEQNHLARQVRMRDPHLLIFNLAGNMVGRLHPSSSRSRQSWRARAREAIQRIKAGAPRAACMVISPLDQGKHHRGRIITRPNLPPAVDLLREVAAAEGCAFWDAWQAMGGEGSMAKWRAKRLGWSDLVHVSKRGHRAMGQLFADAMIAQYQDWLRLDGPNRVRHYRWAEAEVAGR